jgi:hypothetical protein
MDALTVLSTCQKSSLVALAVPGSYSSDTSSGKSISVTCMFVRYFLISSIESVVLGHADLKYVDVCMCQCKLIKHLNTLPSLHHTHPHGI